MVHSIHSQVSYTLEELREPFDLIISLDSHLDISLAGDRDAFPKELHLAAERTSVHTVFRRLYGELPALKSNSDNAPHVDIVITIPGKMLESHIAIQQRDLSAQLTRPEESPIDFYVGFLKRMLDVDVYESPPSSLLGLLSRTRQTRDWLLDIDVDCMHDMQGECYSPITKGLKIGNLQNAAHVLKFIQRSNPKLITMSEAKVAAIRDPKSNFSEFLADLKSLGYEVEEKAVFVEDSRIEKQIRDCADFYTEVAKEMMANRIKQNPDFSLEDFGRQEILAGNEFFRKRGYL
jgi:hypothetical protein